MITNQPQLIQPRQRLILPFLANLALSSILVETHIQPRILLLVLLHRQLPPDTPVRQCGLVAVFHTPEPGGSGGLDGLVFGGVSVDFDVDIVEMFDCIFLELFLRAVLLEPYSDQPELVRVAKRGKSHQNEDGG